MPSPFDQAKGYGFWVSKAEITTGFTWWQHIFDVGFLGTDPTHCLAAQEGRISLGNLPISAVHTRLLLIITV